MKRTWSRVRNKSYINHSCCEPRIVQVICYSSLTTYSDWYTCSWIPRGVSPYPWPPHPALTLCTSWHVWTGISANFSCFSPSPWQDCQWLEGKPCILHLSAYPTPLHPEQSRHIVGLSTWIYNAFLSTDFLKINEDILLRSHIALTMLFPPLTTPLNTQSPLKDTICAFLPLSMSWGPRRTVDILSSEGTFSGLREGILKVREPNHQAHS